jgi:hypothetical protein
MPSESDKLLDKWDMLKPMHQTYHSQVEKNRRYYELDFGVEVIPAASQERGFVPVIPPTARQAIDEAADHILFHPKLRVPARPTESETVTAQDIAEKKRKFLAAWWRQVTQRTNVIGDGRKTLLNEGKIVIRKTINFDLLPDKDNKNYQTHLKNLGKYDFLWNLELLDNVTVFEDPSDHRNPKYVYISYRIYKEEAAALFPESRAEWTKLNDYDMVEYLEYWSAPTFHADGTYDAGKYYQWIERECEHDADNPYPYIPIAIEDAGYGVVRRMAKPEEKYRGFSEFSQSVFVAQARQWSAMEAVSELTAFSPIITRNLDPSKAAKLQLGPGEIWDLEGSEGEPDAEHIEFAEMPAIPITVPQMIQLTDRSANSTLKIDALGGMPQTGVDSATEADQNVRNASAKLSAPVAALERIAAKLSKWVLMDIELVLEAPVTVYGSHADDTAEVTLSTRDISGYYDLWVELSTTDEDAISQNKARFWLEMALRAPFLSYFTALERGGVVDDPMQEMMKRAAEEVFLSDQFKMIRIMTGAQSFGELASLLQQSGMVAGGGEGGTGLNTDNSMGAGGAEVNPGVQNTLQEQALVQRDVNFGSAAFRSF